MFVATSSVLWRNLLDASKSVSNVLFEGIMLFQLFHQNNGQQKQTFVLGLERCSAFIVAVAALTTFYVFVEQIMSVSKTKKSWENPYIITELDVNFGHVNERSIDLNREAYRPANPLGGWSVVAGWAAECKVGDDTTDPIYIKC